MSIEHIRALNIAFKGYRSNGLSYIHLVSRLGIISILHKGD